MIIANEQLKTLTAELNRFLDSSHDTLDNVLNGMDLAKHLVSEREKANISRVIDKISQVLEIISTFKIGIKTIKETDKIWLVWSKTGSREDYYYNDEEKDLPEKMLIFILMSFDREVSQRLSVIEEADNGYIFFCNNIKGQLHRIVTEYITA